MKLRFLFAGLLLGLAGCASQNSTPSVADYTLTAGRYGHGLAADSQHIYALAGGTAKGLIGSVEVLDLKQGSTSQWPQNVLPRRFGSAVWDGDQALYLMGGIYQKGRKRGLTSITERYDTQTGEVTQVAPLLLPTRMNTAVRLGNVLYVLGGEYPDPKTRKVTHTALVMVYDIGANTWRRSPAMPTAKSTTAVTYDGAIYVVGGYDGDKQLQVFERFDPTSGRWDTLEPLPLPISAHSAVVWDHYLLTFGDYEELDRTLAYDFKTGKWMRIQLSYQPSRHNKAAAVNGNVYVVGGNVASRYSALNSVQAFDKRTLADAIAAGTPLN